MSWVEWPDKATRDAANSGFRRTKLVYDGSDHPRVVTDTGEVYFVD